MVGLVGNEWEGCGGGVSGRRWVGHALNVSEEETKKGRVAAGVLLRGVGACVGEVVIIGRLQIGCEIDEESCSFFLLGGACRLSFGFFVARAAVLSLFPSFIFFCSFAFPWRFHLPVVSNEPIPFHLSP